MSLSHHVNDDAPRAPLDDGVSGEDLKDALARLASGLAVIACWDGDKPVGLAATSLVGLSIDPPRLLFCVRHEASALPALLKSGAYTATVLSQSDREEAELFSSSARSADRFAVDRWALDDEFAPRFRGGLASFDLVTERWIRSGAHTIFIAKVKAVESSAGAPLIYFERSFAALGHVS